MSEFKRTKEVRLLVKKLHNKKIKIVAGLRQCGKTYLLSELFYKKIVSSKKVKEEEFIKIFLNGRDKNYRDPINFNLLLENVSSYAKIIFVDEVQEVNNYHKILIDYLNDHPGIDIYVTGSNSSTLSKDIVETFKENGDPIFIQPLTFKEVRAVKRNYKLDDYLKYGGIPDVVNSKDKEKEIKRIYDQLYQLDIFDRAKKEDYQYLSKSNMETIINNIFSGSTAFSTVTMVNQFTKHYESDKSIKMIYKREIESFLSIVEDSFLIRKIKNETNKNKAPLEILGINNKYYCSDCGIAYQNCDSPIHRYPLSLETAVFNTLVYNGINPKCLLLLNDSNNQVGEIDFVYNDNHDDHYLQVTYTLSESNKDSEVGNLSFAPKGTSKDVAFVNNKTIEQAGINYINVEELLLK